MTNRSTRNLAALSILSRRFRRIAVLLLSLSMLAPQASFAGDLSSKDRELVGQWVGDEKDPTNHYEIAIGARSGELQLVSPAELKLAPIALRRVAPGKFASIDGASPTATVAMFGHDQMRLKVQGKTRSGETFVYLLLHKQ